jgi:hypothetical protein
VAHPWHAPKAILLEEAMTVLFCEIDEACLHHPQPERTPPTSPSSSSRIQRPLDLKGRHLWPGRDACDEDLVGLARRIAVKIGAYTPTLFLVNGRLGHPQGGIKDLWV